MEAAPPMIPLVLDLEKQAAALLAKARDDAKAAEDDARQKREADAQAFRDETATQVQRVEEDARSVRENEINKLRSAQASQLAAVRQLAPATLAAGVALVLDRLRETQG